jgi:hypothetical protein
VSPAGDQLTTNPYVASLLDNQPNQVCAPSAATPATGASTGSPQRLGRQGRHVLGQVKVSVPRKSVVAAVDSAPSYNSFGP